MQKIINSFIDSGFIISLFLLGVLPIIYLIWYFYLSAIALEYYSNISVFIILPLLLFLVGEITINSKERSLLPKSIRYTISALLFCFVVYHQYAVVKWDNPYMSILIVPMIILIVLKLFNGKE